MKRCVTCGKQAKEFVELPCPKCGTKIVRCNYCRENANPYECPCGFEGP